VDAVLRTLLQVVVLLVALERRQQQAAGRAAAAERESRLDALTGLPNRRAWEEALAHEQARCERYGLRALVAEVDVDDLKEVNDREGHLAGDVLLRVTAEALRATVREADTVARLGGDEFAVLAVRFDADDPAAAAEFPERLATRLARAGVSASVGIAVAEPGTPLTDAMSRADRSMYTAKRERKGDAR
jgi:diguanylate cyclase (GGDEF)-like protein